MRPLVCDLRHAQPTATTVDALAGLARAARRRGRRLDLVNAPPELDDLLTFCGLGSIFGRPLAVRPRRSER